MKTAAVAIACCFQVLSAPVSVCAASIQKQVSSASAKEECERKFSYNPEIKKTCIMLASLPKLTKKQIADSQKSAIKRFCANRWQADYEMQLYCFDKQNESRLTLEKYKTSRNTLSKSSKSSDRTASTKLAMIMFECEKKWTENGTEMDYSMIEYCIGKQISSMNALRHR